MENRELIRGWIAKYQNGWYFCLWEEGYPHNMTEVFRLYPPGELLYKFNIKFK